MSAALEPVTRMRLHQFRRRQRVLQAARGIAVAIVLAVVVLLLVVLVDANIVINQTVRWCLSLTLYTTLLVWLVTTVRRVSRRESLPETARAFEQLDPRLHEQLLSAVELSEDTSANEMSSPGFRAVLQQRVARAVTPVQMSDLLPFALVGRLLLLALISLGIGFGLAYVPGLHWPHRVARALLPGANLGRISRFDIEILSPNPASTRMPSDDVAAIEARVRGPLPDSVSLETRQSGTSEIIAMRGVTRVAVTPALNSQSSAATAIEVDPDDLVYTANVTLGDGELEYRVIAEDAHTPWYRLTTRPRPQVKLFKMSITPPAYSSLPKEERQSDEGDIAALKGSRVRLEITTDQNIDKGWLQINLADATTSKKLDLQRVREDSSLQWTADLPIDNDFSYRVHLIAAETRFTNAFSLEYQAHAIVDLSPRLTWESPTSSMLVVEPNQLVPMAVRIEDELPLAELLMLTSVNGEPAVAKKLELPQAAEATAELELDLLAAKAQLGDALRVVIQGTDRLGQPALTTPVEMIVSSTAVDPQRRPATGQRIELASELRKFSEQVQPKLKQVRDLHEEFNKTQGDGTLAELKQVVEQLSQQSQSTAKVLREKVVTHLKLPQDSVSLAELERAGQVLARLESEISQTAQQAAEQLGAEQLVAAIEENEKTKSDPQKVRRDRANTARSAAEKIVDSTSVLDRRFREFVAHDVLAEIARGMSVVKDYQQQLASQAEAIPPAQLRRRQAIVARQLRELEQIMIDRSPLLRDAAVHGLRGWIEWSGQMAERIERATADGDDNPNFKEFTTQVLSEVNSHQSVMSVDGGLAGEINNGRKELDARSQTAAAAIAQLASAASATARKKDGGDADELRGRIVEGLGHLQLRKELQQARGDSDPYLVGDLGNVIRAMKALQEDTEQTTAHTAQQLQVAAAALKKLEAIHNVNEASQHLSDLQQIERWTASSVEARTESPRTWDALQQRLEQSARALRESGIDAKLAEQLDSLRWNGAAAEAAKKIGARRWSADVHAPAEAELTELKTRLDATRASLAEVAKAARSELTAMAPTVPELARRAADETEKLEQQTSQLSKSAAANEVPDLKSRLDQLNADQQRTVEPINDLRDALTEMAAMQDLLEDQQREVARDADTSQHIIDKANGQIAESLKPASAAETPAAAAAPLEKAAAAQGEATAALEQIADHFEKLQAGDFPVGELADSRQALKQLASDLDMKGMDEWYKTAEALSKLAGGDPQQVLKRLEDELARNARMREELSDISKQALGESVESLKFSAEQERGLRSQIEQSDPAFALRKLLLQQDIQSANERMQQWVQRLNNDANAVASRAGASEEQKRLSELQQTLAQTITAADSARDSLPLEDLERIARDVLANLKKAEAQFGNVSEKLKAKVDDSIHANEQELRNRKREMEDWERRSLQQQTGGAQAVQRSHEQRLRNADSAARNAESQMRTAQRQRDELQKKVEKQSDNAALQKQLAAAQTKAKLLERDLELAKEKQENLKARLEVAKQNQTEIAARKPSVLSGKNPTAELASRLAQAAAATSVTIAKELEKSLSDTGWMNELKSARDQLQSSGETQQRVEGSVESVAENLRRAARHEQRLEHPQAAERIAQQAERVAAAGDQEVHMATERLATAHQQALSAAESEIMPQASPASSLAARQAIGEAETELRARVQGLKAMTDQPQPEEAQTAEEQPPMPPGATSVPLDPKMLARMLDELDRAMSAAESGKSEEADQAPPSQNSQPGKSEDDNNQSSPQQNSPDGNKPGSQTASMQEAARQLAEQMNRQRAQGRQSTAASRMSSNSADTQPAPPSAVRVLNVDRRSDADWGKLREQAAEETVESARQSVAPQYRQSVETYFRVLSERGHRGDKQ